MKYLFSLAIVTLYFTHVLESMNVLHDIFETRTNDRHHMYSFLNNSVCVETDPNLMPHPSKYANHPIHPAPEIQPLHGSVPHPR